MATTERNHYAEVLSLEQFTLTPEQVADALHCGRTRAYQLISAGEIRSVKIGKLRRVTPEALRNYLASLEGDSRG